MNQPQVENSQQLWRGLNCPMLREVISYNIQLQCLVTDIVQLCLLISFTSVSYTHLTLPTKVNV